MSINLGLFIASCAACASLTNRSFSVATSIGAYSASTSETCSMKLVMQNMLRISDLATNPTGTARLLVSHCRLCIGDLSGDQSGTPSKLVCYGMAHIAL